VKLHIAFGAFALIIAVVHIIRREVRPWPLKTISTQKATRSPNRSIRRMSEGGGEQQIIAKATEEYSEAAGNRTCDALKVSLFKMD
jgi:hypothetical protein